MATRLQKKRKKLYVGYNRFITETSIGKSETTDSSREQRSSEEQKRIRCLDQNPPQQSVITAVQVLQQHLAENSPLLHFQIAKSFSARKTLARPIHLKISSNPPHGDPSISRFDLYFPRQGYNGKPCENVFIIETRTKIPLHHPVLSFNQKLQTGWIVFDKHSRSRKFGETGARKGDEWREAKSFETPF